MILIDSIETTIKTRSREGQIIIKRTSGEVVSKECKSCRKIKDLSAFNKQKGGVGGKRARCRDCVNKHIREDREKNPQKYNSEHRIKYRKNYSERYYSKNSEIIKSRAREYYYARRDDEEFIRKRAETKRRWARENPHMITLQNHRRLSRKRGLVSDFTEAEMQETLERFKGRCALTGEDSELHWDHVIPLSTGYGGTTKWNMIPIKSTLNVSKGDRHLIDWFVENEEYLGLSASKLEDVLEYLANIKGVTVNEYIDYIDWCFENKKEGLW